jgi:formylglycine-generating enzyme required for sulfatase activity
MRIRDFVIPSLSQSWMLVATLMSSALACTKLSSPRTDQTSPVISADDAAPKPATSDVAPGKSTKASPPGLEWIVSKPAGVSFAKTETTVAQWRACAAAGACSIVSRGEECDWERHDRENHPVNCVDEHDAAAFCAWVGGRLPTEQEWYAEASNGGTRRFPWGGDPKLAADDKLFDCAHAVWGDKPSPRGCGKGSSWPVCSKPAGNSVSGLCDMAGNGWEWTTGGTNGLAILRGGSWHYEKPVVSMPKAAGGADGTFPWWGEMGFRCVR